MGGSSRRSAELRSDIDSYIHTVRKRKPFGYSRKSMFDSWWPFQGKSSSKSSFSTVMPGQDSRFEIAKNSGFLSSKAEGPKMSFMPKARPAAKAARPSFGWWEGIKESLADTVKTDLESISTTQSGGTPMKQDDDGYLNFDDGALKVVPIPEDPEPVRKFAAPGTKTVAEAKPAPAQSMMLDPFADDVAMFEEPKVKKESLLSRLFSRKKAAKEEAKISKDFVMAQAKPEPVVTNMTEANPELREDFKELSKIFLKSLERMNKEQLAQFKTTADFDRFKTLLKKHSVIK